jgi:cobalt/nickel transport system permease protein
MTHIMVPDGVLPPWLWITGGVVAVGCLGLALWATRDTDRTRFVPLAGTMAAVMAVVMSLEIVPIGYEPHLTVLAGILLGPAYGFLATFVFNILRMLVGDGSVTLLGLNTLILGAEAVGGYYLFRAFRRLTGSPAGSGVAAGLATVIALAVATVLFLAVVYAGQINLADPEIAEAAHWDELFEKSGAENPGFPIFAQVVLILGAIGWVIEATVIGAITAFLRAVRPSLLGEPTAA